jgi:hypothetical protein
MKSKKKCFCSFLPEYITNINTAFIAVGEYIRVDKRFHLFSDDPDVYFSKETFLQSGYGLPCAKGSPLKKTMNKL